jgi:hypothetical protein
MGGWTTSFHRSMNAARSAKLTVRRRSRRGMLSHCSTRFIQEQRTGCGAGRSGDGRPAGCGWRPRTARSRRRSRPRSGPGVAHRSRAIPSSGHHPPRSGTEHRLHPVASTSPVDVVNGRELRRQGRRPGAGGMPRPWPPCIRYHALPQEPGWAQVRCLRRVMWIRFPRFESAMPGRAELHSRAASQIRARD